VLTFLINKERKWADKYLTETKHRNCPICDTQFSKLFETFISNATLYAVYICDCCGFIFQNPIYNKKHYHSLPCHYPKNYFQHSNQRGSYIYQFIKEFVRRDPKVDVLDIGAGKCEPLKYILNAGFSGHHAYKDSNSYRGTAITMEPKEKIYMGDKWNIDIEFFDFEDEEMTSKFIEKNRSKFDFVIMSHVLEHFFEPNKVIKNIIPLLNENAKVYIEVPSLLNAEYRIKSVWTPEHLSFFNTKTLSRLMFQNNFNLVKMVDSKIWGNIKSVWKYDNGLETFEWSNDSDVRKKYEENRFAKFIQRAKHKLGFKYEANI